MEAPQAAAGSQAVEFRPRLGGILIREGLLTPEQLEEALEEKKPGERLGSVLIRREFVSEEAVARALAEQSGLEFVDLVRTRPDPSAVALLPEKFARRYCALPVKYLEEDVLLVVVADPTNVVSADDLRIALGLNVQLAVGVESDIEKTFARFYGSEPDLQLAGGQPVAGRRKELIDIGAEGVDAPAITRVNALLRRAIEQGASDLHFEPHAHALVVRARVDGVMRQLDIVQADLQPGVVTRLKIMGELDIAERRAPQDGRVSITFGRTPMDLRMAVLPTPHGEQVVLRILYLDRTSRTLDLGDLGMAEDTIETFRFAIGQPGGAVIVSGPTGSGKTTTLYAALEALNDDERVLMTIEDPVELQVDGVNQIEVNPKAGLTFARGLRTILRSDPDVLLVGEIRDDETARIAVQAALTGHLVLTTLHARDAAASIARLKDMGIDPSLLATTVNAIVAQRLVRRLCTECREPYEVDSETLRRAGLEETVRPGLGPVVLCRARGCAACAGCGYSGRVAVYEILRLDGGLGKLIDAPTEEIREAAIAHGMRTMREDGLRLFLAGVTSLDEVERVAGS